MPLEFHHITDRISVMPAVAICEHWYLRVGRLIMPSRFFGSRQTWICVLI